MEVIIAIVIAAIAYSYGYDKSEQKALSASECSVMCDQVKSYDDKKKRCKCYETKD